MNLKLLERLSQTMGVPGREHRVRELILKEIKPLVDTIEVDPMGNLIAIRGPRRKSTATTSKSKKSTAKRGSKSSNATRVMIAAHMDQIGFLVSHIDDRGFLRLNPVGGFDPRNLFARFVTVCPDITNPRKDLTGVMNPSGKPIHIASPEERKKVPEVQEFSVDLGMSAAEVKKKVQIGDVVVLQAPFATIGKGIAGQAMDNRVACWVAIETLRQLKQHSCEIVTAFTVQEEVGLRGAQVCAHRVKPDIGIGLDTTLCVDTPGVPSEQRVTVFGGGATMTVMDSSAIGDLSLMEEIEAAGKAAKVKTQRSILARGGTDTAALQRAGDGCRAATITCPTRYIHTVTETVHQDDLKACRDLMVAWLGKLK